MMIEDVCRRCHKARGEKCGPIVVISTDRSRVMPSKVSRFLGLQTKIVPGAPSVGAERHMLHVQDRSFTDEGSQDPYVIYHVPIFPPIHASRFSKSAACYMKRGG